MPQICRQCRSAAARAARADACNPLLNLHRSAGMPLLLRLAVLLHSSGLFSIDLEAHRSPATGALPQTATPVAAGGCAQHRNHSSIAYSEATRQTRTGEVHLRELCLIATACGPSNAVLVATPLPNCHRMWPQQCCAGCNPPAKLPPHVAPAMLCWLQPPCLIATACGPSNAVLVATPLPNCHRMWPQQCCAGCNPPA